MYKFADVVRATSVPGPTLASWLDRGIVVLDPRDQDTPGSGTHRRFCKERLYQIALTASLQKGGLNLLRSADAAACFANTAQPGRNAGELFATGKTMLVISQTETKIVNTDAALGDYGMAIAIDCGVIVEKVDIALGAGRRQRAA